MSSKSPIKHNWPIKTFHQDFEMSKTIKGVKKPRSAWVIRIFDTHIYIYGQYLDSPTPHACSPKHHWDPVGYTKTLKHGHGRAEFFARWVSDGLDRLCPVSTGQGRPEETRKNHSSRCRVEGMYVSHALLRIACCGIGPNVQDARKDNSRTSTR